MEVNRIVVMTNELKNWYVLPEDMQEDYLNRISEDVKENEEEVTVSEMKERAIEIAYQETPEWKAMVQKRNADKKMNYDSTLLHCDECGSDNPRNKSVECGDYTMCLSCAIADTPEGTAAYRMYMKMLHN